MKRSVSDEKMYKIHYCLDIAKKDKMEGSVLEFGVFEGWSISEMVLYCRKNQMLYRFYGFDGFQGMPESEFHWKKGDGYSSYENTNSLLKQKLGDVNEVMLVPGLFKDSLTVGLQQTISKAVLIHADCDLYSSTAQALWFCEPFLQQGTFIVFDEYIDPYEARAWREFTERTNCVFKDYGGIRERGQYIFRIIQ